MSQLPPVLRILSAHILNVVARAGEPVAASAVFAQVTRQSTGLPTRPSLEQFIAEAKQLESVGLLVQVPHRSSGRLQLACTTHGLRVAGVPARRAVRDPSSAPAFGVAASAGAAVLTACAAATPADVLTYGSRPIAPAVTAQVRIDGRLTFSACAAPEDCPGPTPKTRTPAIASAPPPPAPQPPVAEIPQAPMAVPSPASMAVPPAVVAVSPASAPEPAPPPVARAVSYEPRRRVDSVSVFFATGQASLSRSEGAFAVSAAMLAKSAPPGDSVKVVLIGMTDKTGSPALNQHLSQLRADHVRLLLSDAGVDLARISTQVDTSSTRTVPNQAVPRQAPSGSFAPYRRVDVVITTERKTGTGPTVGLTKSSAAPPTTADSAPDQGG